MAWSQTPLNIEDEISETPMVRNTNTQILVLIARTICAVTDTEKSGVARNSRKTTAEFQRNEQKLFRCKKPVIMG